MKNSILFSAFIFLFFACSEKEKTNEKSSSEQGNFIDVDTYFYQKDTVVQMYVYQNVKNENDQFFERVVYKFMDGRDHFFVTKYNYKMIPISTFSYWNVDGEIILMKANMMVDRLSYESKLQNTLHFPKVTNKMAKLGFDYPSAADSIVNVVEIRRSFNRFDTLQENEDRLPVVIFQDSIRLSFVDVKNKQHKSIPSSIETYYGEGLGKMMETNENATYRLVLKTDYGTFMSIK